MQSVSTVSPFPARFLRHTSRKGQAVAAILVFAGASFFFALAEPALFSLGKWQVAQLAEKKSREGKIVAALLEHPQDLPATLAARCAKSRAGSAIAGWC